jgi:hypothetical protein
LAAALAAALASGVFAVVACADVGTGWDPINPIGVQSGAAN